MYTPRQRSSIAARTTVQIVAAVVLRTARPARSDFRERLLDFCAPGSLLLMGAVWAASSTAGFALLAGGIAGIPFSGFSVERLLALRSGDSVLTVIAIVSGLLFLASFTAHVLRILAAYGRRDGPVERLAARATETPDAELVLTDYLRTGSRDHLDTMFADWSAWLADVQSTHLSFPAMPYLRPVGTLCWAKAALIVLDCAAITEAVAPHWAPPNTRPLLDIGGKCLPRLAMQLGEQKSRSPISFHGREARDFRETFRAVVKAGLPPECDEKTAEQAFLDIRLEYAPYVISISERLLYHVLRNED
ncbi:MAG: hypothetical protein ACRDN0_30025 [Trebonia sp.]